MYGETIDSRTGKPTREQFILRAVQIELAERRSHVETREAEKHQLREYRSARAMPPSEEEIDTAIARINDANLVNAWAKAWLQEQPWVLEDHEVIETLTRAAQSAYKRGRVSLGDVLRHQDVVAQVQALVECALRKTKEEKKDIRFHITEILSRVPGHILSKMPWLWKLLFVTY